MKYIYLLLSLVLWSCDDELNSPNEHDPENEKNQPAEPITTDLKTFIFGHSLINHELQVIETPSQETSVPHWMYLMAQESGYLYNASGQYGFLQQHSDLPPIAQWGFDVFEGVWDSDNEPFSEANFNSVLITAGNFIQWQPASENYYEEEISPIDATLDIIDWLVQQESGMTIYIYENWPDMAPYLAQFPPTSEEILSYDNYTQGDFHDWWLDYHDAIMNARPDLNVRMIPVGPILGKILSETPLGEVGITEFYEDDAPHGRASLYFLAGMVSYMAMYGTQTPEAYQAPAIVHPSINENYADLTTLIWEELEAFEDSNGNSRVW